MSRKSPVPRPRGRPVTLVDSSVVLDIVTEDPAWAEWSAEALAQARDDGLLVINPIVYAEVSTGFDRIEDLDDAVPADDFRREALPTRRPSWPARRSWPTAGGAARSDPRSRTSISARMLRSADTGF